MYCPALVARVAKCDLGHRRVIKAKIVYCQPVCYYTDYEMQSGHIESA